MIVADFSSRDGWEQPILRFFDTLIGVVIGVATAWVSLRVIRLRIDRARQPGRSERRA